MDPHEVSALSAWTQGTRKAWTVQLMVVRIAQIAVRLHWMNVTELWEFSFSTLASLAHQQEINETMTEAISLTSKEACELWKQGRTAAGSNCSPFRRQADLFRLIWSFNKLLLEFREKQRFNAAGECLVESSLSLCFIAEGTQCLQTHRRTYSKHSEMHAHTYNTIQFYLYST